MRRRVGSMGRAAAAWVGEDAIDRQRVSRCFRLVLPPSCVSGCLVLSLLLQLLATMT